MTTSGFLRAGSAPNVPAPAPDGPMWSVAEADEAAHAFLVELAGGRTMEQFLDDPVEHARANGLMLLFSEPVQEAFASYLARMPADRAEAWRDLIAGGASSEAFGPLTLQEKLDEAQVEQALQAGRRQRLVNLSVGAVVVLLAVAAAVVVRDRFLTEEGRTEGAFVFEEVGEAPEVAALDGGPPIAAPELTTALSTGVAVAAGDGDRATRVTVAPFADFPYAPGTVRASLFSYAGTGAVAFVGPPGFTADSCLRASVVTAELRPLDTVTTGPCAAPVGRPATVLCLGDTAVVVDLHIPSGEVALPEGGTGFAEAVRAQVVVDDPRYEVLTERGTIEVGDGTVAVPRFGGEAGAELTFDLGAERIGTCTVTGDLPGGT